MLIAPTSSRGALSESHATKILRENVGVARDTIVKIPALAGFFSSGNVSAPGLRVIPALPRGMDLAP